jgi:hypothetical protein
LAFITTIIATLIGGVLAVGTSVVVRRWEFRQETRIRMFDELLPALASKYFSWRDTDGKSYAAEVSKEIDDDATKLYRAARLSGRRETDIVGPIRDLMRDRSKSSSPESAQDIDKQTNKRFDELESYLTKKLSYRPPRSGRVGVRRASRPVGRV